MFIVGISQLMLSPGDDCGVLKPIRLAGVSADPLVDGLSWHTVYASPSPSRLTTSLGIGYCNNNVRNIAVLLVCGHSNPPLHLLSSSSKTLSLCTNSSTVDMV